MINKVHHFYFNTVIIRKCTVLKAINGKLHTSCTDDSTAK